MSKILVVNDDGINSKGINLLVNIMRELGEVTVVAPSKPQSAVGHAITIRDALRIHRVKSFDGIEAYACSGTPVDCVKIAVNQIFHGKPDFCVSGINHGGNASINVLYSGTMSACTEAALESIPSIGFSYARYDEDYDFSHIRPYVRKICEMFMKNGMPNHTTINVNFPDIKDYKGIKICRQALGKWKEKYLERTDPSGSPYYWLSSDFDLLDKEDDTDESALAQGYISLVPTQTDLTHHKSIETLKKYDWNI